jgi:hypothetical protein
MSAVIGTTTFTIDALKTDVAVTTLDAKQLNFIVADMISVILTVMLVCKKIVIRTKLV